MELKKSVMSAVLVLLLFSISAAADIDCRDAVEVCPPSPDPCRCSLAETLGIDGPINANVGSDYTESGGRANYLFTITKGAINSISGEITAVPECLQPGEGIAAVSVVDVCGQNAEMAVVLPENPLLTLSGPNDPSVGAYYAASGGASPYSYSMTSGSIDQYGMVTNIDECSDSATVTVTDDCSVRETKDLEIIQVPFVVTPGSCFSASGGVAPYDAELSCGATNGLCITSTSGCCGRESMRVFDSCGNEVTYYNTFGSWATTFSGCADPNEATTANCFPTSPFSGCDWTTSGNTRYIVTDWVPLGSSCQKYRVEQEIPCP